MSLVLQAGGGIADAEGNLTIDSPANLEALKFEKDLADNFCARGTPSWTFTEVMRAFEQGQRRHGVRRRLVHPGHQDQCAGPFR